MSISVVCPNGHHVTAKDTLAGKTVHCPKCKAEIQIPPADEPEVLPELEQLEEWDPLSDGGSPAAVPDALSSDPLGDLLGDLPDLDALQPAPMPAGVPTPTQSLPGKAGVRQTDRGQTVARGASASVASIWIAAGSGLLVGLLFTALVGWLLLGGRSEPQLAVAPPSPPPAAPAQASPEPVPKEAPSPPVAKQPSEPAPEVKPPAAKEPSLSFVSLQPPQSPLDLTKVPSDGRLEVFKLPGKTWAADYDRTSGRLAVTNDEAGIVVYDIDETAGGRAGPVGALPTEGLPTAVCFKPMPQRRFVVAAGNKRPKAEVFDADKFEKAGEVPVPDAKFLDYLSGNPNPDDPHVYYSTQRYDQDASLRLKPEQLGRINMKSLEAKTIPVFVGEPGRQTAVEAAAILFSDQGEMLYLRSSHSTTDCLLFETDAEGTDVPVFRGRGPESPSCAVGANGQLVSAGRFVFDRYFSFQLAYADLDVEAFFLSRPLVAGFTADSLAFGSTNDFRTVASVPLPADCLANQGIRDDFRMLPRKRPELKAAFVKVFVDEARDLVIGVLPDHLLAAPLTRLNLPAQKSITVTKRLPVKAYVNEPMAFELETEAEDVTFELGDGRDATGQVKSKLVLGADGFEENLPRISKRTLTWTPSTDQVGYRTIHLRTRQGALTRDWSWIVSVEQRKTDIPFYVTGVNIDVTGKHAAVWGRATASESERKFSLGVLDVAQRKLLQKTEFPQLVQSATVDDSGVYVSFDSQLMRLDRQTLEVKSQTNLGSAAELQVVGGKYLAAMGRQRNFQRFRIPELAPVEPAVNSYGSVPLGGRLDDQWMWDGVLWDAEMKTPQLLAIPAHFGAPGTIGRGFPGGGGMFGYQSPGRYAGPCNTTTPTFQTGCTPFGYAGILYVQYGRLNVHPNDRRLAGASAEKPLKSVALSSGSNASKELGYLSCGREVVAVAYGGQLSWIPTAELLPAKASFGIAHKQSTFVLGAGATSVRYEAKDAAKYSLELWTRQPDPDFFQGTHLKADSTDGSFTLSLPPDKLVDDAVDAIGLAQFPGSSGRSLDKYLAAVTPAFESLVGRKPNGVPFPVLAVVTAESSYGETDALVHFYLVEVPRASVEGKLQ